MDGVGTKKRVISPISPVIRRLLAEKAERRYVAGKEKESLTVPGVVRQDEQKAIYVLPWDSSLGLFGERASMFRERTGARK